MASATPSQQRYVGGFFTAVGAVLVVAVGAALISALLNLWPVVDAEPPPPTADGELQPTPSSTVNFLWGVFSLSLGKANGLIVLAFVAGAFGAFVQASRAFAYWANKRELKTTWLWWYAIRIVSGGGLAVLVYFAIRGGLFGSEAATGEVNAYGTAAFAGLVGLFTTNAIDKLQDVFNTVFGQKEDTVGVDPGSTPREEGVPAEAIETGKT